MPLTALIFLLIVIGGTVLSFVRHPVWGIYAYVLIFYFDAPSRWWSYAFPNLRWSMLIVAVTIIATVIFKSKAKSDIRRESFASHAPQSLFVLYVAWMYLQLFWSTTPDHAEGVSYFTKYAIVMYLIYSLVDNRERVIGFLTAHVLGCFYLGLIAFSIGSGGRLDGVGGAGIDDSNNLGIYVAAAALAAGGLYLVLNGWLRIVPILVMPFLLNTLVQAGSRGAFLALLGGCLAMYYYRPPGTTTKVWGYGVLAIILFVSLASSSFWDRMATIQDAAQQTEEADRSAMSRIYVVKDQWRMATDHPFGVGHKGTAALSYQYISSEYWSTAGGRASHNTLLSALVDQGFLGLFIWCAISWTAFKKCRDVIKRARQENDVQLGWLTASILGVFTVTWIGGIFAPFLKGEVFVWMIPLICTLWSSSSCRLPKISDGHSSIKSLRNE